MKRYFITPGKRVIDMEKVAFVKTNDGPRRLASLFRVYISIFGTHGYYPNVELVGKEALKFWDAFETRAEEINERADKQTEEEYRQAQWDAGLEESLEKHKDLWAAMAKHDRDVEEAELKKLKKAKRE